MKHKRLLKTFGIVVLLLFTLLALGACAGRYTDYEICETRLYDKMPSVFKLQSLNMVCKEADAELESISSKEPIDASGTSYLVF